MSVLRACVEQGQRESRRPTLGLSLASLTGRRLALEVRTAGFAVGRTPHALRSEGDVDAPLGRPSSMTILAAGWLTERACRPPPKFWSAPASHTRSKRRSARQGCAAFPLSVASQVTAWSRRDLVVVFVALPQSPSGALSLRPHIPTLRRNAGQLACPQCYIEHSLVEFVQLLRMLSVRWWFQVM